MSVHSTHRGREKSRGEILVDTNEDKDSKRKRKEGEFENVRKIAGNMMARAEEYERAILWR